MDKYVKDSKLRCNVVTSLNQRPMLSRRLSRKPKIKEKPIRAETLFQRSNNEKEIYRMGEKLVDLNLTCKFHHEDDKKFLEELEVSEREAYIYSAVPGSLFQHCPLIRGIKGDPENGTYTGTVAPGTTVYFPQGDASSAVWMEETDFTNNPIMANGMHKQSSLKPIISADLPLGRGVAILSEAKNMVKNSLFADDGSNIYNWTHSGALGMARSKKNSWMGVNELWVWGAETWVSDSFDISSLVDGDTIAVSFGWRTDGEIRIRLRFQNGIPISNVDFDYSDGCGYQNRVAWVPVGFGGVGGTVQVMVSLNSGQFGGVCAPQAVLGDTANGGRKLYPAFLGGSGNNIQGEITAQSLKYTGEWQAGMWSYTLGSSNSFLCVSGYVQTLLGASSQVESHKFLSLVNQNNKEMECHLKWSAPHLKAYLRADGTALASFNIVNYSGGDVFFVAMSVGWTAGVCHKKLQIRIVGDTTTYTAEHTGTAQFFTMFDTLWVGSSENEDNQADCLFQDVNIWAGTEDMIDDMVVYMANPDNLMEHRDTCGRLYRISADLNPNPHNRQRVDGTLKCENTRVL